MYIDLDDVMEEYLLTLDHTVDDNGHHDSEDYSEREEAQAELERFVDWLNYTKKLRIAYTK